MPAGVGYKKADLTGVRAKLEALNRRKKKGKSHSSHGGSKYMDQGKMKSYSK